jgi:hypothetical protein
MSKSPIGIGTDINRLILTMRGQKVILASDLARIYGVETFRFNEAVKRNLARFPEDFLFRLSNDEWAELKSLTSRNAILKPGRGKHQKYPPYAFTEHGALMAANLLKSPRAIEMSVYVIRAFVRMRGELAQNQQWARRLAEIEKTLMGHDSALRDLYNKIRPLLTPPEPKRGEIGFHTVRK